jgi:hypothetical protein
MLARFPSQHLQPPLWAVFSWSQAWSQGATTKKGSRRLAAAEPGFFSGEVAGLRVLWRWKIFHILNFAALMLVASVPPGQPLLNRLGNRHALGHREVLAQLVLGELAQDDVVEVHALRRDVLALRSRVSNAGVAGGDYNDMSLWITCLPSHDCGMNHGTIHATH